MSRPFTRLSQCVRPLHYSLRLKPDLRLLTFRGWLNVELEVRQDTQRIECNAAELEVKRVTLNEMLVDDFQVDKEQERLNVNLQCVLSKGQTARMSVVFDGVLNDQLRGFYRSKYVTDDNEERFAAATQFEATSARRCFPCWDEPALKATFALSLIAPKDRVVISNTSEIEHTDHILDNLCGRDQVQEGQRLVQFATTPIMSTYLLAVVVGEFSHLSGTTKFGQKVRVFTPLGKADQGEFALVSSEKSLEYYTDFFNIPYPLSKYDCVALADFEMGAMENWGLVTFRESCVLIDPNNSSAINKEWVAEVVMHEMAHQWFGNLVTMEWWTHLWLNEGFATFMSFLCTDNVFPEFHTWSNFVTSVFIPALELDALSTSHPIEVEVNHPDEVDEIFDDISYCKGASIIRMLFFFIGESAFREGMHNYLKKHSYSNAFTEDLWNSLATASKKPVDTIMTTWTKQKGFPVINVRGIEYVKEEKKCKMSITQEKFSADSKVENDDQSQQPMWQVPINIVTKGGKRSQFLLDKKSDVIVIEDIEDEKEWIKLNADWVGFFHVNYPMDYLANFAEDIRHKRLNEMDRLNLLNDLFALVESGRVSSNEPLKLLENFRGDDSFIVWRAINNFIGKLLYLVVHDEATLKNYKTFVCNLLDDVYNVVGWEANKDEKHTHKLLRDSVLSRLGWCGHEKTLQVARKHFEQVLKDPASLNADLRSPVYRTVSAHADQQTVDQLIELYKSSSLAEEKQRIGTSLGSCQNLTLLSQVLDFSLSDHVRAQDMPMIAVAVGANPLGREVFWTFFKDNFDTLQGRYGSGGLMQRLVTGVKTFADEKVAKEVEDFFETKGRPVARSVDQTVERIRIHAQWWKRDEGHIKKVLSQGAEAK